MARRLRAVATAAAILFGATVTLQAAARQAQDTPSEDELYEHPYIGQICGDNVVSKKLYNGARRYGNFCHRCHGEAGLGSSFAPSLVESLKRLSREQFEDVVVNGRRNLVAGQEKVMPSFGDVTDVMLYLEDIYAYLKAVSDGKLKPGPLQRGCES